MGQGMKSREKFLRFWFNFWPKEPAEDNRAALTAAALRPVLADGWGLLAQTLNLFGEGWMYKSRYRAKFTYRNLCKQNQISFWSLCATIKCKELLIYRL